MPESSPLEERRLSWRLPDADDAERPSSRPFADEMIEGAGFHHVTSDLVEALAASAPEDRADVVRDQGSRLWRAAVDRAQQRVVSGWLPAGDDRPLYWTRLSALAALSSWSRSNGMTDAASAQLREAFDKASRGMSDIDFPPDAERIIVSGFDPYGLDGGATAAAPGTVGNNLRHGNPSGAVALALDGTEQVRDGGQTVRIEAYVLPLSYERFSCGYLEDAVGPWMSATDRRLHASITVSQGRDSQFDIEEWNARYRGPREDNEGRAVRPDSGDEPVPPAGNPATQIVVVGRWGGPDAFDLNDPPQWTRSTLPVEEMIAARTGRRVVRPLASTWPNPSEAFGVVRNARFIAFPDPTSPELVTTNDMQASSEPDPVTITPPSEGSASFFGGGGNYLSNESAYRNTLLRDRLGVSTLAGHIHTPDMQHFESDFGVTDATFDEWRRAIVEQTIALIGVVGDQPGMPSVRKWREP